MSTAFDSGDNALATIPLTKSGKTYQSASSTSKQEYDFLDFLGIAQSLDIDFLPITWQPALDNVGEGGTAVIHQTLINSRMTFIFKHLKRPRSAMERIRNLRALIAEISILGHPIIRSHPNIASIEGICWDVVLGDGEEVWPVLVFEKTQHGDLNRFMTSGPGKELDTKNRLDMLFDVALAVRDLHTTGIVHGDIKPDNILVFFSENDGRYMARVMDFGYSTLFRTENDSITMPNSGLWTAPEQHHRKISPSQARKMDAYSFGILCVWVLFYNKKANRDRNFKKDLEYSQRELSSYTSGLLKASVDFEDREKDNMQKIFRSTLAQDPADRSASFNEFLDLLSQDRALHSAPSADIRPIPHEDFQITSSLHQLIEAHYSVRYYLAKCLEERESQSSTSQCHTLNLAVCYELGIGVRQDIKRSRSLLGIHGISIEDLEHKIEQVKKTTGSQQFQKGIFRTFLEQGHFLDFDLSQEYREEQRACEAESRYQEEVEAMGSVLGEDHHLVQELQVQLSLLMSSEGRWKDAERLQVQMIGLDERGTSDRLGALLAMTYTGQGRWDKAEKLQMKVLEARERLLGTENPKTLTSKNNLALIHWNLGRWKEAEELEVQIVETSKRVFGEDHPSTLINTTNLAATYRKQRRWEEAKKLDLQVTESGKKVLGMEHPDTLSSIGNLASTYQGLGQWKEAEELQVSVMEMTKKVLGAEHPETLLSINNLAGTYLQQGRRKEAEELQVQAMEARKRVLGMEHSGTLAGMNNLAMTYFFQERWEEAEELQVHVMKTSKMVLGTEHEDTLTRIANLILTYLNQGRLDEAEELQVYVRKTSKKILEAEHPNTLISINNLAMIYKELERWQEAEDLKTEITEIESRLH